MANFGFGRDLSCFWTNCPKGSFGKTEVNTVQTFVHRIDKTRIYQNSQNFRRNNFPDLR